MEIQGEIKTVIFNNPETGYTVLDVAIGSGEVITAVGIFPPVAEAERVVLRGTFKNNSRHGYQFVTENVEVYPPEQAEAIVKYLSSGLFKGIGEVTARAIVTAFGTRTLDIIENSPTQLYKVRGVSLKKAMEIGLCYNEVKRMNEAIMFLQQFTISLNMALKIYQIYGDKTVKVVKENPYRLVDDVDRIGFATADRIAKEEGIAEDSDFRIKAGITFVLKEAASKSGHTYLPEDELVKEVMELLKFPSEDVGKVLANVDDMLFLSTLAEYDSFDHRGIMLYKNYVTEKKIARRLIRLLDEHRPLSIDPEDAICRYELINKITLHENQKEAVKKVLSRGVEVITGGPGTGKTTIVKCIVSIFRSAGYKVNLCAPTGRAAKRLSEATGEEAKTIHRLLDLDYKDGKGFFTYNENTRLDSDVVIVDEVSMVDEYVFNALISAVKTGASLILVGDKDQLPSVGAGNVLADIIGSEVFDVTYLTHIYRQAEESLIVTNAHRINRGEMPVLDAKDKDFFFEEKADPLQAKQAVVDLVTSRLPKFTGESATDIQVLCPMKKGVAGVENLNREIRKNLNPKKASEPEIKQGENSYRVGDKIMQIVNNYQMEWTVRRENYSESGTGVYNGDIGFITEINMPNQKFTVTFTDGKVAVYSFGELDQIVLAYAVSIHKSQGSEFDTVVISVSQGNPFLLTRNLLYTAITRAKKTVVVVGTKEAVGRMVRNNYTATRYSLLKEFVREEVGHDE